jgi:hypothetical protein
LLGTIQRTTTSPPHLASAAALASKTISQAARAVMPQRSALHTTVIRKPARTAH